MQVRLTCVAVFFFSYAIAALAGEFIVGASVHVGQNRAKADNVFALLQYGEFNSFRDEVYWARLEKQKGVFAFPDSLADLDRLVRVNAHDGNMAPLLVLDYGNNFYDDHEPPKSPDAIAGFARYCRYVALRYRGARPIFEVWNEWNGGMGSKKRPRPKGSAEDYVGLLEKAAPAIRAAAPNATILGGATAGYDRKWTDSFVRAGGLKWIDGFSVHPYVYDHPFKRSPEDAIVYLEALQSQLHAANGGKDFPVYVTEIGWSTYDGAYGISEQLAANYLTRFLALAASLSYVRGVWWYELVDGGNKPTERESRFGLASSALTPKPALGAIRMLSPVLRDGNVKPSAGLAGNARMVVWDLPNGDQVTAMWAVEGKATLPLHANAAKGGSITQLAGKPILRTLNLVESSATASVELDQSPIVLRHAAGRLVYGR